MVKELYQLSEFAVTDAVAKSFSDMPLDNYFTDGTRRRRFAQFRVTNDNNNWNIERLPLRPFIQPKKNNSLAGGIARYFKGIQSNILPIVHYAVERMNPDPKLDWQVNVHQYRIEARDGIKGTPVPEGPHQDGVDQIMMLCAGRNNVQGGQTTLWDNDQNIVLKHTLQQNEAIAIDDSKLFHDASQILVVDTSRIGTRDLFVIGLMRWSYGKYGEQYEINHTGSVADLTLLEHD